VPGAGPTSETTARDFLDTALWRIIVTNTGGEYLTDVTVTDDEEPACDRDITSIAGFADFAPDAVEIWTCETTGLLASIEPNTATVTAVPVNGTETVDDVDTANVTLPDATTDIAVIKFVNGDDANTAPGLYIPVGDTASWTYQVTNTGVVPVINVVVVDDAGTVGDTGDDFQPVYLSGDSDSDNRLDVGEVWLYESPSTETLTVAAGAYANIATATGNPITDPTVELVDEDPAHHYGVTASIQLVKKVQTFDANTAPGPRVAVGADVRWTFEVTNTGNVHLADVTLNDPLIGNATIDCDGDNIIALLAPGDTIDCVASSSAAAPGQVSNIADVIGTPSSPAGEPIDGVADVTDDDPANYIAVTQGIDVEKSVQTLFDADTLLDDDPTWYPVGDSDSTTVPLVATGSTVKWTFVIRNTGSVALHAVTFLDDQTDLADVTCDNGRTVPNLGTLGAGEVITCTTIGNATEGNHLNTASVTGTGPTTVDINGAIVDAVDSSDDDTANYTGIAPAVEIVKYTQTVFDADSNDRNDTTDPWPLIRDGGDVKWTYKVTNSGSAVLTDVEVTDDKVDAGDIVCSLDAPSAGTTDLADGDNSIDTVAPGDTYLCVAYGTAGPGDYQNTGTVTGTGPGTVDDNGEPVDGVKVTDNNPSHYYGAVSHIDIEKAVQTLFDADSSLDDDPDHYPTGDADSTTVPFVKAGSDVLWTFQVHNSGNTELTDVTITDDKLAATSIDCGDGTNIIGELPVDGTVTCTATGTAPTGTHTNTATATGTGPQSVDVDGEPVTGETVTDTDTANLYGADPHISITKYVNGYDANVAPGLIVKQGDPLTFQYVVTNTGNTELADVTVTDDQGVIVNCGDNGNVIGDMAIGAEAVCTGTAIATFNGQYTNIGTVSGVGPDYVGTDGQPVDGDTVTDDDPANVFTPVAAIDIIKYANGDDANSAPGVLVGWKSTVTFTYVVTNTGNVALADVTVTDDRGVIVNCGDNTPTIAMLEPSERVTCTGTSPAGLHYADNPYRNIGSVSGTPVPAFPDWQSVEDRPVFSPVTDNDPAHYHVKNSSGPTVPETGSNLPGTLLPAAAFTILAGIAALLLGAAARSSR